eukprot:GHVP01052925.1.p1 GENE.GHVP01052925.1~~GHVP01052925.1.p1  ORF type:complete len:315 (-),score=59.19 GHVP01052925.1:53-997(-)
MFEFLGLLSSVKADGRSAFPDIESIDNQTTTLPLRFYEEIVDPLTRLFWGQDSSINEFASTVALASTFIKGKVYRLLKGNDQYCDALVSKSEAKLHFNSPVSNLEKVKEGWKLVTPEISKVFDSIVISAPLNFHSLSQNLPSSSWSFVGQKIVYVEATGINFEYFGIRPEVKFKQPKRVQILSTKTVKNIIAVSIDKLLDGKAVYKIYASKDFDLKEIDFMFSNPKILVKHIWDFHSYSLVAPNLDIKFVLDEGLFTTTPMEYVLSTLESQCISAANSALLAFSYLFSENADHIIRHGILSTQIDDNSQEKDEL